MIEELFQIGKLAESIASYLKIVEDKDAKIDKLISKEYESAVNLLKQVRYISNPAIYSGILVSAVDRFNQAIVLEKRERKLYSYLGLMLCYYFLDEKKALISIQQTVSNLKFEKTFWEENGPTIIGIGQMIVGIAALMSGNSATGKALVGTSNQNSKSHEEIVKRRESKFYALRNKIIKIKL